MRPAHECRTRIKGDQRSSASPTIELKVIVDALGTPKNGVFSDRLRTRTLAV
jgi:hypothetical protein